MVAGLTGRKAPKHAIPTPLLKALTPVGPLVGKLMGQPPNLREMITSADGVTFWASHEKASRELGFDPRGHRGGPAADARGRGQTPRRRPDPARPDAADRRRAPRAPACDLLLGGRRRPGRPRPRVLAREPAGGDRRRGAAGARSSPTSTSTTPPRPARWCGAGRARGLRPRARRPAPDRPLAGCWPAPRASTATRWSASGARSCRCPRPT